MADPRVVKLAQVLVNYSVPVQSGDWFVVRGSELAAPLIREVYREALKAGAHVETRVGIEGLDEIFLKNASDEQLTHISEVERLAANKVNSTLNIMAPYNLKGLSGVDPKKQSLASKARAELFKIFMQRSAANDLRWSLTLYPTQASAQEAGMSLSEYEDFVYGAMLLDRDDPIAAWQEQGKAQQRIADFLTKTRELRIVGKDTDLRLTIAGRKWENAHGRKNFPDGEVFSAPVEDSVNGVVAYTYPAI
ncbi:MAG: aminopeptidase, partial [Chloroflexi bacterium]|nr:aminopeptidase [Chloroflexota bacterium]